jgi:hypothetical protein
MTDRPPTIVITMIHSAASKDGWSAPDGRFSSTLKNILAGEGLVPFLSYFHWSGRNRVGKRRRAARDLASQLTHLFEAHPGAVHFLIGERRGGAVVCRGMLPVASVRWKQWAAAMASRSLSVASLKSSWWKKLGLFALTLLLIGFPVLDFLDAGIDELFGFDSEILLVASALGVCFFIAHWLTNESDRFGLLREISGKDELESSLLVVRLQPEDATDAIRPDALAEVVARFVTAPPHGSISS